MLTGIITSIASLAKSNARKSPEHMLAGLEVAASVLDVSNDENEGEATNTDAAVSSSIH